MEGIPPIGGGPWERYEPRSANEPSPLENESQVQKVKSETAPGVSPQDLAKIENWKTTLSKWPIPEKDLIRIQGEMTQMIVTGNIPYPQKTSLIQALNFLNDAYEPGFEGADHGLIQKAKAKVDELKF